MKNIKKSLLGLMMLYGFPVTTSGSPDENAYDSTYALVGGTYHFLSKKFRSPEFRQRIKDLRYHQPFTNEFGDEIRLRDWEQDKQEKLSYDDQGIKNEQNLKKDLSREVFDKLKNIEEREQYLLELERVYRELELNSEVKYDGGMYDKLKKITDIIEKRHNSRVIRSTSLSEDVLRFLLIIEEKDQKSDFVYFVEKLFEDEVGFIDKVKNKVEKLRKAGEAFVVDVNSKLNDFLNAAKKGLSKKDFKKRMSGIAVNGMKISDSVDMRDRTIRDLDKEFEAKVSLDLAFKNLFNDKELLDDLSTSELYNFIVYINRSVYKQNPEASDAYSNISQETDNLYKIANYIQNNLKDYSDGNGKVNDDMLNNALDGYIYLERIPTLKDSLLVKKLYTESGIPKLKKYYYEKLAEMKRKEEGNNK